MKKLAALALVLALASTMSGRASPAERQAQEDFAALHAAAEQGYAWARIDLGRMK